MAKIQLLPFRRMATIADVNKYAVEATAALSNFAAITACEVSPLFDKLNSSVGDMFSEVEAGNEIEADLTVTPKVVAKPSSDPVAVIRSIGLSPKDFFVLVKLRNKIGDGHIKEILNSLIDALLLGDISEESCKLVQSALRRISADIGEASTAGPIPTLRNTNNDQLNSKLQVLNSELSKLNAKVKENPKLVEVITNQLDFMHDVVDEQRRKSENPDEAESLAIPTEDTTDIPKAAEISADDREAITSILDGVANLPEIQQLSQSSELKDYVISQLAERFSVSDLAILDDADLAAAVSDITKDFLGASGSSTRKRNVLGDKAEGLSATDQSELDETSAEEELAKEEQAHEDESSSGAKLAPEEEE